MNNKKLNYYTSLLQSLGNIRVRTMFGVWGVFIEGTMVALFVEDKLHIRASNRTKKVHQQSVEPYSYMKDGFLTTRYFPLPEDAYNRPELVISKAREALSAAKREKAQQCDNNFNRIKDLPNLQLKHERMLAKIGIYSADQLREKGAMGTYIELQQKATSIPLDTSFLWVLEGAITGVHWAMISSDRRNELLNELRLV